MVREFAVEPELFASKSVAQRILDEFGVHRGRLIAQYPKNWLGLALASCRSCSKPAERKYLEDRIIQSRRPKLARRKRKMPNEHSHLVWLASAEKFNDEVERFHAIVATGNPRSHQDVLVESDLDEDNPRWAVDTGVPVPRRAAEMANLLLPLVRNARDLVIVDPYFAPESRNHQETLWELLGAARVYMENLLRVELHLNYEDSVRDKQNYDFRDVCLEKQKYFVPAGTRLSCFRWHERSTGEELHDRYVLTDLGGVQIGAGLGEKKTGATTRMSLLDRREHDRLWSIFADPSESYDPVDSVELPWATPEAVA